MPAMSTVIWTSSGVLAGKVAGALRSIVQLVPPSVVRRSLSVPLPVGIVRSSMIKPVTGSEKLKGMGGVGVDEVAGRAVTCGGNGHADGAAGVLRVRGGGEVEVEIDTPGERCA